MKDQISMVKYVRYGRQKFVPDTYFAKSLEQIEKLNQKQFDKFALLFMIWVRMTECEENERKDEFQKEVRARILQARKNRQS